MKYSNPLPKEGINTTATHPLKELLLLTSGLLLFIIVGILILGLLADKLAQYVPYEAEVAISQSITSSWDEQEGEVQAYLQGLANKLSAAQHLPEDMPITIHYVDNETVNAMATLGGHVIMFNGLLSKLNSENALAMVLAHEIAHIQHRHPIQTLSRGAVISIALNALGLSTGDARVINNASLLTALTFSRHQEQGADFTALRSLENYYGHVNGATDLFEALIQEEAKTSAPRIAFFSSHPLSEARITNILEYAQTRDWNASGKLTPIPRNILTQLHHKNAVQP